MGLVAIALAGLIAAIAITASTSWTVGEALKLPRSINLRPQRALPFYLSGFLGTALIILIPHATLGLLNLTMQVVASIFMPAATMFLLMLLNDHEIMDQHVNRPWQNMAAFSIVGLQRMSGSWHRYPGTRSRCGENRVLGAAALHRRHADTGDDWFYLRDALI